MPTTKIYFTLQSSSHHHNCNICFPSLRTTVPGRSAQKILLQTLTHLRRKNVQHKLQTLMGLQPPTHSIPHLPVVIFTTSWDFFTFFFLQCAQAFKAFYLPNPHAAVDLFRFFLQLCMLPASSITSQRPKATIIILQGHSISLQVGE